MKVSSILRRYENNMPTHAKVRVKSPNLVKPKNNPKATGNQAANIPEVNSCLKRAMERLLSNNFPGIDPKKYKESKNSKSFSELSMYFYIIIP